jgi:hypothetical protein
MNSKFEVEIEFQNSPWVFQFKFEIKLEGLLQQQQQQYNLLSQASWGRLEMKPKETRNRETHTMNL